MQFTVVFSLGNLGMLSQNSTVSHLHFKNLARIGDRRGCRNYTCTMVSFKSVTFTKIASPKSSYFPTTYASTNLTSMKKCYVIIEDMHLTN
jgi:hypothetical protein